MATTSRSKDRAPTIKRLVIDDLTPEVGWGVELEADDHRWLESLSELSPERFIMRAQLEFDHEPTIEPILVRDMDGWRAGRYIGEIRHQGRVLEVRPRLGIETVTGWISAILNVQVLPRSAMQSNTANSAVTQLLAALWRATVIAAGQHAIPRSKVSHTEPGLSIRGRLEVPATARRRAAGYRDLVSTRTVRSGDNAPARAVVLADRYFDQRLVGDRWRGQRMQEQLTAMRSATGPKPALPSLLEIRRAKYSPITLKWRRAAELSWRILRDDPLGSAPDDDSTHGVLIDVAELWELFVLHCAGLASDEVVRHGTSGSVSDSLACSTVDPERTIGKLYPDVFVGEDPLTALLDAKYKRLGGRRGVDREDLYQLHAYSSAFGAPVSALAYPSIGSEIPEQERLGPWQSSSGLLSFMTLPTTEPECVAKLAEWLRGPAD